VFHRQHKEVITVVEKETVFVPVTIDNYRPKADRWKDKDYLQSVVNFSGNQVFRMEMFDALASLRMKADTCDNSDMLKGINHGIRALNALIAMPFEAHKTMVELKAIAEANDKLL
jgi:hypothetical protein